MHRSLGWSLEKIDQVLRQESGLLGLSNLAKDMRSLETARDQGHAGATLAIEVFCYRLAKTLAAVSCARYWVSPQKGQRSVRAWSGLRQCQQNREAGVSRERTRDAIRAASSRPPRA